MPENERPACPHCGAELKKWKTPPMSTWASEYQWVCFNDECPYFVRGWEWMMESQNVKASYRHCMDPKSGKTGPLPTWSYEAHKSSIIKDE